MRTEWNVIYYLENMNDIKLINDSIFWNTFSPSIMQQYLSEEGKFLMSFLRFLQLNEIVYDLQIKNHSSSIGVKIPYISKDKFQHMLLVFKITNMSKHGYAYLNRC